MRRVLALAAPRAPPLAAIVADFARAHPRLFEPAAALREARFRADVEREADDGSESPR